jgi:hypothetical protein
MPRPYVNAFGNFMRKITDPLIADPVERAVRAGSSDLSELLKRGIGDIRDEIGMAGATTAAGNTIGGLSSGVIGGLSGLLGMGLGGAYAENRAQERHQELIDVIRALNAAQNGDM